MSETHWAQAGQKGLALEEVSLYFRHEEENASRTYRFPLTLSKGAQEALI